MLHYCRRKLTKEQYDRAANNNMCLTKEDYLNVFTESEIMGYGVYSEKIIEEDGEYYIQFLLGSTCD